MRKLSRYVFLVFAAALIFGCAQRDTVLYRSDTEPPVAFLVSESSGRISWETNEDCFCVLLYGEASNSYDHYGYNVHDGGIGHYVDLIDIEPGTYYFRIISTDYAGNSSTTRETTFTITEIPECDKFRLTVVDVGWGDCLFLEFPSGTRVMIDSGSDGMFNWGVDHTADVFRFLNFLGVEGPDGIDYMIATHAHRDHYGGFFGIIPVYSQTVFMSADTAYLDVTAYVGEVLDEFDVPTFGLREGQSSSDTDFLNWDEEHGVEVKVLSAGAGRFVSEEQQDDPINCDSVVLKVSYGLVDFLLTGDAEEFVEQRMIKAYGSELECEVLKVGHHGNDDATSEEFLKTVKPRVGLISNSLEENDGVFDQSVINLLRDYLVDYYVTDRAHINAGRNEQPDPGNLTVTTDGETYIVKSWQSW